MNKYDQQVSRVLKEGTLNLYANGTTGDDDNDGLSVLTPKKTLEGVFTLLPKTLENVAFIHLEGEFNAASTCYVSLWLNLVYGYATAGTLFIEGGSSTTTVYDDAGSPFVSDSSSVNSIGLSTLAMTTDQYKGYWLEVLDGPCAGVHRTIIGNTATEFNVVWDWAVPPGNCQFRITRPSTTINQEFNINTSGNGLVVLNNLFFTGTKSLYLSQCHGVGIRSVIFNKEPVIFTSKLVNFSFGQLSGGVSANPTLTTRALIPSCTLGVNLTIEAVDSLGIAGFVGNTLTLLDCGFQLYGLIELNNLVAGTCRSRLNWESYGIMGIGGYPAVGGSGINIRKSTGVGVRLTNCDLGFGIITISDCASHAIEAKRSRLTIEFVTGSGNGGAGVYLSQGTICEVATGAAVPTVTGTIGDTSTDGTTEASTWAAIAGGVAIADASEFSLIKAV